MILYKLTFANGKSYIGITSTTLQRRLSLHRSHAKKEIRGALQRAIRKYGFETIGIDVLAISDNWENLCKLEKLAIVEFNAICPNGYNMTQGGEGALGVTISEETRAKISRAKKGCRKGIPPRPAGWHHSEESRRKIGDAARGAIFSDERKSKIGTSKIGNKNCLGKICSLETREKISAAQRGKPRGRK